MEGQGKAGGERPVVFLCEALKQSCAGTCQSRVSRRSGSPDSPASCRSHMKERERDPVMVNLKGLLSRACILGRDHSMEPPFFHLSHWFHQQAQMM